LKNSGVEPAHVVYLAVRPLARHSKLRPQTRWRGALDSPGAQRRDFHYLFWIGILPLDAQQQYLALGPAPYDPDVYVAALLIYIRLLGGTRGQDKFLAQPSGWCGKRIVLAFHESLGFWSGHTLKHLIGSIGLLYAMKIVDG